MVSKDEQAIRSDIGKNKGEIKDERGGKDMKIER
jgi:hypothetical protein